jgi:hypothetical protein
LGGGWSIAFPTLEFANRAKPQTHQDPSKAVLTDVLPAID